MYDPACGTGGFFAQSYEYMKDARGESLTAEDITTLGGSTFYGREKAPDAFPIALANLMLHGGNYCHARIYDLGGQRGSHFG